MQIDSQKDFKAGNDTAVKSAVDTLKAEATQQADSQKGILRNRISDIKASIDDLESSKIDSATGSINSLTDKAQVIYSENNEQNLNRSQLKDETTMTLLGKEEDIKNPQYKSVIEETFKQDPTLAFKGTLETDNYKTEAAVS